MNRNQTNQIQKQQQENNEVQYPPTTEITYPYSVRIEQSAKGARISVHCYNRYLGLAAMEAIEAYLSTRRQLAGILHSPVTKFCRRRVIL